MRGRWVAVRSRGCWRDWSSRWGGGCGFRSTCRSWRPWSWVGNAGWRWGTLTPGPSPGGRGGSRRRLGGSLALPSGRIGQQGMDQGAVAPLKAAQVSSAEVSLFCPDVQEQSLTEFDSGQVRAGEQDVLHPAAAEAGSRQVRSPQVERSVAGSGDLPFLQVDPHQIHLRRDRDRIPQLSRSQPVPKRHPRRIAADRQHRAEGLNHCGRGADLQQLAEEVEGLNRWQRQIPGCEPIVDQGPCRWLARKNSCSEV